MQSVYRWQCGEPELWLMWVRILFLKSEMICLKGQLPFQYYDDRPHGKILVRVINYVNNVSDMLSNGIINFILEVFNIIFILIFMLTTDVKLTFVVLAGLPFLIAGLWALKPEAATRMAGGKQ